MTALGVVLMDKSGRRPLLLVGTKKSESSGLIVHRNELQSSAEV